MDFSISRQAQDPDRYIVQYFTLIVWGLDQYEFHYYYYNIGVTAVKFRGNQVLPNLVTPFATLLCKTIVILLLLRPGTPEPQPP